ncbi:MAG: hypothetical protein ABSE45_07360 [Candidatus Acidiferrales bacterium]|jgi:hypothetical protein
MQIVKLIKRQLLLRADNTPFASARTPIFFADKESRDSLIEEIKLRDVHPASPIRVIWEWWRVSQSQYHYKESGTVDLGDLNA